MKHPYRIGIFDSGIGGLTVARAIRELMPAEPLLYVADNDRAPYGKRSAEEVLTFSRQITRFLADRGCRLIVVACNTATSVAIDVLRADFPELLFVGMEPAVKPAALSTRSGKIGVMATELTLKSDRYQELVDRYAPGVVIYADPCRGLVSLIEAGANSDRATEELLQRILHPMLEANIDTLVLGCTHYPLILPQIKAICGPEIRLIDPAPASAQQIERLANSLPPPPNSATTPLYRFHATGSSAPLERALTHLDWTHRLLVPHTSIKQQ